MTLHLFPYLTRIAHTPKHRCAVPLTPFAPSISVKCSLFTGTLRRESTRRNKKSRLRADGYVLYYSCLGVEGKTSPYGLIDIHAAVFFSLEKDSGSRQEDASSFLLSSFPPSSRFFFSVLDKRRDGVLFSSSFLAIRRICFSFPN